MRLIAQMVARNESNRYLEEVLEHLQSIADVIVFTDDCSTDDTVEIAKSFNCKVFEAGWDTPLFESDESALRFAAWKNLEQIAKPGDWVLGIDADEKLYGTERLPELLTQTEYDILGIVHFQMWSRTHFRVDGAWYPHMSTRFFRYQEGGTYKSKQLAGGSEPTYVEDLCRSGKMLQNTGLKIMHLGYARDEDKQAKYDRYMVLDGGRFHSLPHLQSIIDTNPTLDSWDKV